MRAKKWWARGHGNLQLSLQHYTLARDGLWHLLDAYGQKQPPFIMPLPVPITLCSTSRLSWP